MKIMGYLYALGVAGILTYVVSIFYKVTNPIYQGITLTLLYIFVIHFGQGDHCLINGIKEGINPMYIFNRQTTPHNRNNNANKGEEFDMDELGLLTNDIISTPNLDERTHANDLYEDNLFKENRLEKVPANNLYYALSNQYYPMNTKNQINRMDCTNDGSCLIPEDAENMHPVRQSLEEVLPVPNIGPQETTIMNRLNLNLNANSKYPVPVESKIACPSTPLAQFYQTPTPQPENDCSKCSGPTGGNNENEINEQNNKKEMFGLFDTYNMADHTESLTINAPPKNLQMCRGCTVGFCQGGMCTTNPNEAFERHNPLAM